jgi:hypothetical protein
MSIHDDPTFTGLCSDCKRSIVVGTRCPKCALKSLVRADLARLRAEHGVRCVCIRCLVARGEARRSCLL